MNADLLEALHLADQRLVRSVDSLTDSDWSVTSLLPGWTRAHVVAHLALNAEGFDRALGGVQDGEPIAVYDSTEARDAAIEDLATEDSNEIRDRLFSATSALRHTFGSLTGDQWQATVDRLPDGPVWPVTHLLTARRQEVEIHHADLDLGYGPHDWPADFATVLLDRVVGAQSFAVNAVDSDLNRICGVGSPAVRGTTAALAWWLLGRGNGADLSSEGELPQLSSWMAPAPKR
jgi:maleylpyruvate isomerase